MTASGLAARATADRLSAADRVAMDDPLLRRTFTSIGTAAGGRSEAVSHLQLTGLYCVACAGWPAPAIYSAGGVAHTRKNPSGFLVSATETIQAKTRSAPSQALSRTWIGRRGASAIIPRAM